MSRTRNKHRDEIFFFGLEVNYPDSTSFLRAIFRWIGALHIPTSGQDQHRFFFRHQVLIGNFFDPSFYYFRPSFIIVFFTDLFQFSGNYF